MYERSIKILNYFDILQNIEKLILKRVISNPPFRTIFKSSHLALKLDAVSMLLHSQWPLVLSLMNSTFQTSSGG